MLPPFIIEEIRKREELERRQRHESVIQLPLPDAPMRPRKPGLGNDREREREDRGVVIIDLTGS